MVKTRLAHYRLDHAGELVMTPPAPGAEHGCTPYLQDQDGQMVLCVTEGSAFHRFEISAAGVGRLGAEAAEIFWKRERRSP